MKTLLRETLLRRSCVLYIIKRINTRVYAIIRAIEDIFLEIYLDYFALKNKPKFHIYLTDIYYERRNEVHTCYKENTKEYLL